MNLTYRSQRMNGPSSDISAGFTLIELLVVIAIMTLIIGIGVPSMMAMGQKPGVQYAADEMFGVIQDAKMRAIRTNQPCTISFDMALNQYQVSLTNEVVRLSKYRGNVTFGNSPNPADPAPLATLQITPQGFATAPGSVYIRTAVDDTWYRLRTSFVGLTSVDRYNRTTQSWN